MSEQIIEIKKCACWADFNITDIDMEFLDKLSPVFAWEKYPLPVPSLCPDCRKFSRLVWRNEKKIYRRKCDLSWKDIIAIFPPTSPFKIYEDKAWDSEAWDAKDYGKDFDFSRPFFEQWSELLLSVPLPSRWVRFTENSEYCNASTSIKNCYLSFSINTSENLLYCVDAVRCNSCTDCFWIVDCENCYECILASWCYDCRNSYDIRDCRDSDFLLSCENCTDCYWCFDLKDKRYCIYNIEYSKEAYEAKLNEIKKLPFSEQKNLFEEFYRWKYIKQPLKNIWSENVVDSEQIINSKNISHCKHVLWGQDLRYCQKMQVPTVSMSMDYTWFWNNCEKIYYSQQVWNNASNIYFSVGTFNDVSNIYYSAHCRNWVQDCFWCVSLIHAESYCILNKQYTREEYGEIMPKIIEHMKKNGEWWEFFPASISTYWYDDSVCQILSPLTQKEAIGKGYSWSGYEAPFPKVDKIIPANKLPENISDIPDDILNWAIECEVTNKPFRVVKQELDFYRKHALPIPRLHPDKRYSEKLKWYINY
ncbi:MAG: Caib/baif family protein [uncultured bacterium (gcode 4)]|uniref:Caib/baif family protein n=1 Tax=uncultured bacterium (gcode 4) TaxID=1234023 RepID=K2GHA5_9BACT|nr:MAG: Caib/baif family protein [uncultured bacterium (gcode 4)]